MKGFKNVKAYVYGKGIITTNIGIENGRIAYVGDDQNKITETLPYENGQVIVPGFIDQHIHGAGGADAMDASLEALSPNDVMRRGFSVAYKNGTAVTNTSDLEVGDNLNLRFLSGNADVKVLKITTE